MRSEEPTDHFNTPTRGNSKGSEDVRSHQQQQQPSYTMYNRDTYQMSPLLFESDTDDTSQSTEVKCYQEPANTSRLTTNDQPLLPSTVSNLRNDLTSPLNTPPSHHNRCCSDTLLNSLNQTKANTSSAYISPSPRVTRSRLWRSRVLTRSAKRLHKISELSEYSSGPRSCRKAKTKSDLRKEMTASTESKCSASQASERQNEDNLIETIRRTKVCVVLERIKFPFFQNPHKINGKFAQPNIVPNLVVDNEDDDDPEFLNRRPSTEVEMFSERPAIISISSESTVRNVSTTPRASPDLFENFDNSSASNLYSQNSIDIPNGQIVMRSSEELQLSNSATSTPNMQRDSTLLPSVIDLFDEERATPNLTMERQRLIATDEDTSSVPQLNFEITVNEVFNNVIYVTDSEETLTPQIVLRVEQSSGNASDNPVNNVVNVCTSSQEITPKKRPELPGQLNRSVGRCSKSSSTSLTRSKWLRKSRPSDGGDTSGRTPQRCRRLDRSFDNERDSKPKSKGYVDSRRIRFSNILLTSSEDEDS